MFWEAAGAAKDDILTPHIRRQSDSLGQSSDPARALGGGGGGCGPRNLVALYLTAAPAKYAGARPGQSWHGDVWRVSILICTYSNSTDVHED